MRVLVGRGSCGNAAGAGELFRVFQEDGADVSPVGCIGMCYLEPIVDVVDEKGGRATFVKVDPSGAADIAKFVKDCAIAGLRDFTGVSSTPAENFAAYKYLIHPEDKKILGSQKRIALANCGIINPESIDEYVKAGGYEAIKKALAEMSPEEVID